MEKTLHTIQNLAKVGKVLSSIVLILCIIAAAGCLAAAVCGEMFGDFEIKLGGITISNMVETELGLMKGGIVTVCAVSFVLVMGEVFLAGFAKRYFKHEIEAGTPFTMEGAKELKALGLKTILIPVISYGVAALVWLVMTRFLQMGGGEYKTELSINLGLGIMFIVGSLLCKLGVQQNEEKKSEGHYAEN